jgi:hypothetical protein
MNINDDSIITVTQDQVYTNLEDEVVILSLKGGVYYGLNPVGARIWNLIQEPRTVKEIFDIILSEYEVEPKRCKEDLLRLLQELASRRLIKVSHGQAS